MARQKNTVEYFPFYVKDGKTLYILQKKYGLEGIGFFTQLFRYLSQVPDHWICIDDEIEKERFLDYLGIQEEKCNEILDLMSKTGKIDAELWHEWKVICSQDFYDSLDRVYSKRQNEQMTVDKVKIYLKDSGTFRHFPALSGNKGKERKGKERKVKNANRSGPESIPEQKEICDSKESPESKDLITSESKENRKTFHKILWAFFTKVSPEHFKTKEDRGREAPAIKRMIEDAMARDLTFGGQKVFLGNFLRTAKYVCNGHIKSFLNGSPFIPSVIMSKGIKPRILELMMNKIKQIEIIKKMGVPPV